VIYLILKFVSPFSLTTLIYARDFMVVNMGLYFASLLVIPWTGNRNYCRYLCPWGSLYGLIGRLGFFKVVAEPGACFDCDICEDVCDMGVPILSLIREKGEINVADCVGCGRCVQECPTEALRLVDVRDALIAVVVR
jgi:polyferredoxin